MRIERIEFEAQTSDDSVCAGNNCPKRFGVQAAARGKLFISKRVTLDDLAPEDRAKIAGQIGPDEHLSFIPDDLL